MADGKYDVAIVGGGIIGLSTARTLAMKHPDVKTVVLDKEDVLAAHQTGHNSGVIHSGIYYRPGSQKAQFCVAGVNKLIEYCDEKGIPYERCGKVIVATDESELGRLDDLHERGTANGVQGLEVIGPERLKEIEPYSAGIKALYAPGTGIVDFTAVANAYADDLKEHGGEIRTGSRVNSITKRDGLHLDTETGHVEAKHIINCAGLHCDRVASMLGVAPNVRIIPFRGEYYVIRPESHHLVKGLIYPVPNPRFPFLGVHFTRTISGMVEAGPNAVLAMSREGYRFGNISLGDVASTFSFGGFWTMTMKHWKTGIGEIHRSMLKSVFLKDLQRLLPEVKSRDLAPGGSGVRAQAVDKTGRLLDDFYIEETEGAIHVLNAPSPGATSSLAIGEYIAGLAEKSFELKPAVA